MIRIWLLYEHCTVTNVCIRSHDLDYDWPGWIVVLLLAASFEFELQPCTLGCRRSLLLMSSCQSRRVAAYS